MNVIRAHNSPARHVSPRDARHRRVRRPRAVSSSRRGHRRGYRRAPFGWAPRVRHRRARLWLRQEASREWEGRLVQRRGQPGGDVAGQPGEEAVRPLPRHRPAQVLQLPRRRGMEGEELQHLQVRASGIRPDQGGRLHGRLRGEGRRGEVWGLLEQPGQEAGTDSVREVRREKIHILQERGLEVRRGEARRGEVR
ncbi:predicted protein [Micromonas commoda]|uniref:Uncharacterized protein n=1 Tax=Micromonas commoda (strain RCC299 / NOUM17 / CCMP2709) TaxID=296587 RepID=C1FER0_MICCC|nr:predicted protein [Micromonas commoda]ACO68614.1 predicted protein [Micromonas commoda]|eukprot:XP_002507356.1 predicted protein [Micromonas commoda]